VDDSSGRESQGTSLVSLKCDFCGGALEARQGRCPGCGSVIGDANIGPNVLLVLDVADKPGQVQRSSDADLVIDATRPEPVTPVVTPVWRSGPNSLGLIGKTLLTAAVLAVGYLFYLLALAVASFSGSSGLVLIMLLMVCFGAMSMLLLWKTWRPTRAR